MNQVLLMTMILAAPIPSLSSLYESARKYDAGSARFIAPDNARRAEMTELAKAVATGVAEGAPPKALLDRASRLGFHLSQVRDGAGELWLLREAGERRGGGGLYAFRAKGFPVCIEAPHTFFDAGTGTIALELFERLRAACLFTNTFHRHTPGPGDLDHPADVAHAPRTFFMAAHEGIVAATKWSILQIHGFGSNDRIGDDVAAIVSDGQKARPASSPAVLFRAALASRLRGGRVLLFGTDTNQLGATTNIQGQNARVAGRCFIHVELSAAVREDLKTTGVAPLADALKDALKSQ